MEHNQSRLAYTLFRKRAHSFNRRVKALFLSMSFGEKSLTLLLALGLILSTIFLLWNTYTHLSTVTPAHGGSLTEGIVGIPRFINPILATTELDKSLSEIIYAGLYTYDNEGNLIPELAERLEIVNDGTRYVVLLKKDLYFHDGTPLTASDIAFTIEAIQDAFVRSPLRPNWNGVEVRVIDARTIEFNLPTAYTPFIHNLTVGVLPKHIWGEEPLEQMPFNESNLDPIGSGPYKIGSITTSSDRLSSKYRLNAFTQYALGMPYINSLVIRTYGDENDLLDAWQKGGVDATTDIPFEYIEKIDKKKVTPLISRKVFAVFFNQNEKEAFRDSALREALIASIDKDSIVQNIFSGYAQKISSPMPFMSRKESSDSKAEDVYDLFKEAGWQINKETDNMEKKDGETLSFTLHTSTAEELVETADALASEWKSYGINVDLNVSQVSTLLEENIRPRSYEALLFGYVVSYDNDLYGFWHSSGRNDPGLNTSLYTNIQVDGLLEKIRETRDKKEISILFEDINTQITKDSPALFLFSPHIPYVTDKTVGGKKMKQVISASDRFMTVHTWFLNTKRVWNAFAD